MQPYTRIEDNTGLNGIRLICSDDSEVVTAEGRMGSWSEEIRRDFLSFVFSKLPL